MEKEKKHAINNKQKNIPATIVQERGINKQTKTTTIKSI